MQLTKSSIYGLRASILLTQKGVGNNYITIRELSEELNISFHFLTKILQQLSKSEILESFKGPNGGVRLAKPPNKITLKDIVTSIDIKYRILNCPLGMPGCGELSPCPLQQEWQNFKFKIEKMMTEVTLEDLSARSHIISTFSNQKTHYQQKS